MLSPCNNGGQRLVAVCCCSLAVVSASASDLTAAFQQNQHDITGRSLCAAGMQACDALPLCAASSGPCSMGHPRVLCRAAGLVETLGQTCKFPYRYTHNGQSSRVWSHGMEAYSQRPE